MVDAVFYRVMQDIQSAIQGAIAGGTLGGLSGANVVIEKIATDRNQPLPAVVLSPLQEDLSRRSGLNDRDDVTYNVLASLVAADNQDQSANSAQELNWRQNVRRLFHGKRLGPATIESVICYVKPQSVVQPEAWGTNLFVSMLVIQAVCRELRTQG